MKFKNLKEKITNKLKTNTFFQDKFGFENGIDITDDNEVLYRKNIVIKNIIFVANLIYTLIFTIITIGDPTNRSNWLLTVLLFPITFLINHFLGKMIKRGSKDNLSQRLSMYLASFYMFLSSILIYIKLKYGDTGTDAGGHYLAECGYILIYISLLITAFYQDKKMLKNVFVWVLVGVTLLHFVVTYSLVEKAQNRSIFDFLGEFFTSTAFRDILIRTILLALFMLILYIYVAMTNYMQEERKKEQEKRRNVQEIFTNSISEIINSNIPNIKYDENEISEADILSRMSIKLAEILHLSDEDIEDIGKYARLYIDINLDTDISKIDNEDEKYYKIRNQSGNAIIKMKRLELKRRAEEISRYVLAGYNDSEFIKRQREMIKDTKSQIVLICDIYISMRSNRIYKKAYNHSTAIQYMNNHFLDYFDGDIFSNFIRFSSDFDKIYSE